LTQTPKKSFDVNEDPQVNSEKLKNVMNPEKYLQIRKSVAMKMKVRCHICGVELPSNIRLFRHLKDHLGELDGLLN
jgi:hypothetical protein